MVTIQRSCEIFAASHASFPAFLTGSSNSVHPRQGVIDLDDVQSIPPSISTELAISHPQITLPTSPTMTHALQSPPIRTSTANAASDHKLNTCSRASHARTIPTSDQ